MPSVHQLLPSFGRGDAIGNEVAEIRDLLRSWGYKSEIFVEHVPPGRAHGAKSYMQYGQFSSADTVLIYHHSIGSALTRFIRTLPDRKVVLYHNITPYEWYAGVNDYLAYLLKTGREELASLKNGASFALADSEYNRLELESLGFANTAVFPLMIDFSGYSQKPDQAIMEKMNDGYTNILFVGRISPNKCADDLIKTYYCYKKFINPKSRLVIVGSHKGTERYRDYLTKLVDGLGLEDVVMTGAVGFPELLAYYRSAGIFVSMSEHEGFCVPLLEAMHFNIPIIAYDSTAVPYTLGNAGLLFKEKDYLKIAELINIVVTDAELKDRLVRGGRQRLKEFDPAKTATILKSAIEQVLA